MHLDIDIYNSGIYDIIKRLNYPMLKSFFCYHHHHFELTNSVSICSSYGHVDRLRIADDAMMIFSFRRRGFPFFHYFLSSSSSSFFSSWLHFSSFLIRFIVVLAFTFSSRLVLLCYVIEKKEKKKRRFMLSICSYYWSSYTQKKNGRSNTSEWAYKRNEYNDIKYIVIRKYYLTSWQSRNAENYL
jgi:preprotein translocase subunit SecG